MKCQYLLPLGFASRARPELSLKVNGLSAGLDALICKAANGIAVPLRFSNWKMYRNLPKRGWLARNGDRTPETKKPAVSGLQGCCVDAGSRLCTAIWCPEGDSNSHSFRKRILNPPRLPIPPSGLNGGEVYRRYYRWSITFHGQFCLLPLNFTALLDEPHHARC